MWPEGAVRLPIGRETLDVGRCLQSGQVFTWRRVGENRYAGAVGDTAVLIEQRADDLLCATWPPKRIDTVERFFALDVNLSDLQADWIRAEPDLEPIVERYVGLRILRQRAAAAAAAFVCSECNNVPRITRMVMSLSERLAPLIEAPWGPTRAELNWDDLTAIREGDLRALGFGYRALHLDGLARAVSRRPSLGMVDLECASYADAHAMLIELPGIGPKVADCVCLFGLGHDEAVPVDTHVRRYIVDRYASELAGRSMTRSVYATLAERLRGIMGTYAGWAQQYVYMAARDGLLRTRATEATAHAQSV